MLTQRIFDPRRHLGKDRARDDALTFKIAQLHREHVLAHASDRSPEFIEAAWTSQELPQDQHFPFPAKNRQSRVDLRGRLAERSGMATGLSHLFHTTPQNPSYLCVRCSSRYLPIMSTSTWEHIDVSGRNRTHQPFQSHWILGFENPLRACVHRSRRRKAVRS